jgi:hypothetical protein
MAKAHQLAGEVFGRLHVIERVENNAHGNSMWKCRCECGEETVVGGITLKHGHTKSCGCLQRDRTRRHWERRRRTVLDNHQEKDGCWEYLGAVNEHGYGTVKIKDVTWMAHRLSYRRNVGPIPEGMQVLHRCDNPACINPGHLWLGTHNDNMRDMKRKGRRLGVNTGEENGAAKLTWEDVDEIRARYEAGGISQEALATEYDVTQTAIYRIVRGKTWQKRAE